MNFPSIVPRLCILTIVCCIPFQATNAQQPNEQAEAAADDSAKPALPEYWLGISLRAADATLLSQLGLEHGVIVDAIAEEGPAAKSGIRQHDVITKAGKFEVKDGNDLIDSVADSKGKELNLQLRRAGKELTVTTTPVKRPDDKTVVRWVPARGPANERIASWIDALANANDRQYPDGFELSLVGPAVTLTTPAPLPDDVTITVERSGSGPAKITVKRGSLAWNITEKEIETLPEDLRGHCRAALGMQLPPLLLTAPSMDNAEQRVRRLRVHEAQPNPLATLENEVRQLREEIGKIRRAVESKLH